MSKHGLFGILLASSLLFAGCAQQGSEGTNAAAQVSSAAVPAKAPLVLFNAYTAKMLAANHDAGTPTTEFSIGDKVYVGAVIHGEGSSVDIKVEWSLVGGPVMGSEEATIQVATAAVATLDLTKAAPLGAGTYKAVVLLNGKPSWELHFKVGE